MAEIAFSIPVTGTIQIQGNSLVIKVNEATINMKIDMEDEVRGKLKLERGKTLFDIVLDTAKSWVEESGTSQFTAAQLYHEALDRYPELNLKRNSWGAHVISSAPDHPSYKNYTSKRNYFTYMGKGLYRLNAHVFTEASSGKDLFNVDSTK
ncbi:hypothetical protein ACFLVO_03170 [Chloroflexota bacterium]